MFTHTDPFGLFITLILGLGWGSFATMATYRLPRNMPWIGDEPRCFMCKHQLTMLDYFSILSYFILNGTCRHCKGKYESNISYFLTELFITIGLLLCYMKYGFEDGFMLTSLLVVTGTIIAVIDAEHKKIPAKPLLSLLLLGAVYRTFMDQTFYGALYGGIAAGIAGLAIRHVYFMLKGDLKTGRDYMQWQQTDRFVGPGFDYVKLLAICGVFLPFVPLGIFIIVVGIICLLWKLLSQKNFRIGTIMASSLALWVIYPEISDKIWNFLSKL